MYIYVNYEEKKKKNTERVCVGVEKKMKIWKLGQWTEEEDEEELGWYC